MNFKQVVESCNDDVYPYSYFFNAANKSDAGSFSNTRIPQLSNPEKYPSRKTHALQRNKGQRGL